MDTEQVTLPFNGTTTLSRECSRQGAVNGAERVGRQCLQLLTAYADKGPLTDRDAARALGVERTTINARRAELVQRGLVVAVDVVKGERGINNTRWSLANKHG